ncbi:MAG: murein L,D-transpeptidase catalytic domain family protein [Flavisolibacter sp.]
MKKNLLLLLAVVCLSVVFVSFSNPNRSTRMAASEKDSSAVADSSMANREAALSEKLYDSLNLQEAGLTKQAVDYAVKGYEKLVDSGLVKNPQYLTIVDLGQSSRNKRFYILDMQNDKLVWNTFVAHGRNSGVDVAKSFSNDPNSNKSSLGFYVTESTYRGKHGTSLRINGLEHGFNDNAEARGVVVHGAPYVNPARVNSGYMGRSEGCPALPENEYAQVINIIKDGSVLFVYNPDPNYLQSSSLLN